MPNRVISLVVKTQRGRLNFSKMSAQSGVGIRYIAVLYVIYHLTHSPLAIGATLGIPSVTQILLAPVGGIAADYIHRPRFIAMLYGLSGLTLGVLWFFLLSNASLPSSILPEVYALYGITAAADTLVGPAYATWMTDWVAEGALVRWEGMVNALSQAAWLFGVLLTGFTITDLGPEAWLLISATLFMIAAFMMVYQFEPRRTESNRTVRTTWTLPAIRQMIDSLFLAGKHFGTHPFLWAFVLIIGLSNVPHNMLLSLPFFLSMHLRHGYGGFSVLEACVVVGSVLGNLWIAKRIAIHRIRDLLVLAFFTQSVICLILWMGSRSSFITVLILLTLYGSTDALFTPAYAHLSAAAPQRVRGQVLGLFNVIALLATPIGTVGLGWLLTISSLAHIILGLMVAFGALAFLSHRMAALKYDIQYKD